MLEKLKRLLAITDNERDALLGDLLDSAKVRLQLLIGADEVPAKLEHIVVEVAVIRFNRIGSEGMNSHSVEGESLNYGENDFSGFMDEIQAYLDAQNAGKHKVRFL